MQLPAAEKLSPAPAPSWGARLARHLNLEGQLPHLNRLERSLARLTAVALAGSGLGFALVQSEQPNQPATIQAEAGCPKGVNPTTCTLQAIRKLLMPPEATAPAKPETLPLPTIQLPKPTVRHASTARTIPHTRPSARLTPSSTVAQPKLVQAASRPAPKLHLVSQDVSYPDCIQDAQRNPTSHVDLTHFVAGVTDGIVGLNGGHIFSQNPCFDEEVSQFKTYSVYLNTNNPGPEAARAYQNSPRHCPDQDIGCFEYNMGAQDAKDNVDYIKAEKLQPKTWYLDAEIYKDAWQANTILNQEILGGLKAGLSSYGAQQMGQPLRLALYSTPYQANAILGKVDPSLGLVGMDNWEASAQASQAAALPYCDGTYTFVGGHTAEVQYQINTPSGWRDMDISC